MFSFDFLLTKKNILSFKIIDDDVDFRDLKPADEVEALVDLLDPEGPVIVDGIFHFYFFFSNISAAVVFIAYFFKMKISSRP